jgi:hypothetical protein
MQKEKKLKYTKPSSPSINLVARKERREEGTGLCSQKSIIYKVIYIGQPVYKYLILIKLNIKQ